MFYMNNDMSLQDMKTLLSVAKNFDAETFDSLGRKTLVQLCKQIRQKDLLPVILSQKSKAATVDMGVLYDFVLRKSKGKAAEERKNTFVTDDQAGHLLVVRMTVKTHVEFENFELLETSRTYTKKDGEKESVPEKKDCANTETRMRRESVLKCARRSARYELGIKVHAKDFKVLTSHEIIGDIHPSSVYPPSMVLSRQIYQAVRLVLPTLLWENGRTFHDDGVEIRQDWFPIKKRKEYL